MPQATAKFLVTLTQTFLWLTFVVCINYCQHSEYFLRVHFYWLIANEIWMLTVKVQSAALSRHKNAFAHIFSIITLQCGEIVDMDWFNGFHAGVCELVASHDVFGGTSTNDWKHMTLKISRWLWTFHWFHSSGSLLYMVYLAHVQLVPEYLQSEWVSKDELVLIGAMKW